MADTDIALHSLKIFLREDLIHQPHSLMGDHLALGTHGIADCDATALLPAMLQGKQPIIDCRCHIISVKIIHAKDAAFLV